MERLKIFAIAQDSGVCTAVRLLNPLHAVQRNDYAEVILLDRDTKVTEDTEEGFEKRMSEAHVVWFGRSTHPLAIGQTRGMQADGKRVVVDLDDNIFSISPWSAHYGDFGTSEFSYDGGKVWEDGENIDLAANQKKQDLWKRYLGVVDAVTVTTHELAQAYIPYAKRVIIIPNAIDFRVWDNPHVYRKTGDVRIFWQGGISHYEDWDTIRNVFLRIHKTYPQVKWVFQGVKFDFFLKDIPPDRYEFHPWVPYDAHAFKMQTLNIDIGIAPLANTPFNRCKSNLKVLEYAAMRVPSVASDVAPYSDTIQHGANGFLAGDEQGFFRYLSELVEDSVLRVKMGNMAYHTARGGFDIDVVSRQMVDRFKELCFS